MGLINDVTTDKVLDVQSITQNANPFNRNTVQGFATSLDDKVSIKCLVIKEQDLKAFLVA
jgi:hypothetical protein